MKKRNLNDRPEIKRTFTDGSTRNAVTLETVSIGEGTYLPGWRWSAHVGSITGKSSEAHIGYVVSGTMVVKSASGAEIRVGPGEAFEVGPDHDAWVSGDEPCIALDMTCLAEKK